VNRILITGGCGQLGVELAAALEKQPDVDRVFVSDINTGHTQGSVSGKLIQLDALDKQAVQRTIEEKEINQVYHLAAILSANGEKNPSFTWNLNMNSLMNILELAVALKLDKIFWPSSIAVFGPSTPKKNAPQNSLCEPATMYGISKLAGERLCAYYRETYALDVRSLRYPGLISYKTAPGGGTTDYAVDIFHQALRSNRYTCFLNQGTQLPFMYMPDAIRATTMLMDAPQPALKTNSAYNISGFNLTPGSLGEEIRKYIPGFTLEYAPDFRQAIAENWPESIDDEAARSDWNWRPAFNAEQMAKDMLDNLKERTSL
jgi:nucleoside-diphosphate-sugar epimerase